MYQLGREEQDAVQRVIESKQLFRYRGGEGGETEQFELEWAEMVGVNHAIAVTSGTAALMCGLAGLGIGPGDEVIVPAYTWMATPMAALAVGIDNADVDPARDHQSDVACSDRLHCRADVLAAISSG